VSESGPVRVLDLFYGGYARRSLRFQDEKSTPSEYLTPQNKFSRGLSAKVTRGVAMDRREIETRGTLAIKRYLDSQKNWITRVYAKRQLTLVSERLDWFAGEVLDIGCGRGILEAVFRVCSRSFTSCDIVDTNFYGIEVKLCSAERLPFDSNKYDSVFMLGVIEHLQMPDLAVHECHRVLRTGGKLIISIPNGPVWRIMQLVKSWLPEHLKKHARFGQKQLYPLMDGWTLLSRQPVIPGLFWLYEFVVEK